MTAIIIDFALPYNPDRGMAEIADFGHPQWPGWWVIILGLLMIQVWMLFQPVDMSQLRPRPPRPGVSRTVRDTSAGPDLDDNKEARIS